MFFFFFQAEDGIRDHCVTGVQTCALPISSRACATAKARCGSPGRSTRSASWAAGRRWIGWGRCSSGTAGTIWETPPAMARRRTTPKELPDAVREAVERTVQATVGSARGTRQRAQGAVDELVGSLRGAESNLADRLPATRDDIRELKAELRSIGRRLDAIEERLPKRSSAQRGSRT